MHSTLKKIALLLNSAAANPASASASASNSAATAASNSNTHSSASPSLSHPTSTTTSTSSTASLSPSSAAALDLGYRFLYYNSMNLVLACTWDVHHMPLECVRGVRECQTALQRPTSTTSTTSSSSSSSECVLRLRSGQWVAGRRAAATQRHFIALFDDRLGSLQEVQREMEQLTRALFHNVCFE